MPKHHVSKAEKAILKKRPPIKERLAAAFEGEVELKYWDVANRVFPQEDYPRSWRRPMHGGPPGCYMALSVALTRYGYRRDLRRNTVLRPLRRRTTDA